LVSAPSDGRKLWMKRLDCAFERAPSTTRVPPETPEPNSTFFVDKVVGPILIAHMSTALRGRRRMWRCPYILCQTYDGNRCVCPIPPLSTAPTVSVLLALLYHQPSCINYQCRIHDAPLFSAFGCAISLLRHFQSPTI